MNTDDTESITQQTLQLWKMPVAVWGALLILLAMTVSSAYLPLGSFNIAINLAIAAIKAGLIALFFMKLNRSGPLLRLASVAGLFWLALMFILTGSDYLSR